jgi:hypothetical protein
VSKMVRMPQNSRGDQGSKVQKATSSGKVFMVSKGKGGGHMGPEGHPNPDGEQGAEFRRDPRQAGCRATKVSMVYREVRRVTLGMGSDVQHGPSK